MFFIYEEFMMYLNGFKDSATQDHLRVVYLTAIRKLMLTDEKTSNQLICNGGLLPLLGAAAQSDTDRLKSEALWVLTNIAGGETKECIKSLADNKMHEIMMDIICKE